MSSRSSTPTPSLDEAIATLQRRHEELLQAILREPDEDTRASIAAELSELAIEIQEQLERSTREVRAANARVTAATAAYANAQRATGAFTTTSLISTPFRAQPTSGRTPADRLSVGKIVMTRAARAELSAKHKKNFAETFKMGLSPEHGYTYVRIHEIVKVDKSDSSILATVDILGKNKMLFDKFASTESTDIFTIYIFDGEDISLSSAKLDLFTNWLDARLSPDVIVKSCDAFTTHTDSDGIIEDLMWSKFTVLNSIADPELFTQVDARLSNHDEVDQTGPLAFYYLMKTVANCDEETLDKLSSGLTFLKLSQFPNEDVGLHASHWKKIVKFLDIYNKVPVNAKTKLLEQYDRCSVTAFRYHFRTLLSVDDARLHTVPAILAEGTEKFTSLTTLGKWHPTTKKGNVFQAQHTEEAAQEDTKPKANVAATNKHDAQPPKEPSPKKNRPTHDRRGQPIDYTPPKKDEPHTRMNPKTNKEEHWCGTCPRWGNHLTDGHAKWKEQMQEYSKKREANKASGESTTQAGDSSATTARTSAQNLQVARPQSNFSRVTNTGLGF